MVKNTKTILTRIYFVVFAQSILCQNFSNFLQPLSNFLMKVEKEHKRNILKVLFRKVHFLKNYLLNLSLIKYIYVPGLGSSEGICFIKCFPAGTQIQFKQYTKNLSHVIKLQKSCDCCGDQAQ